MYKKLLTALVVLALLGGCVAKVPQSALQLAPESLADRQLQTRRFDTANHKTMLGAAAATLQDLGFTLDETEYTLGVLVASKQRDATSGGQVAAAMMLAALTGAVTHVDSEQIIRVSMVMREISPEKDTTSTGHSELSPESIAKIKANVIKAVADGLRAKFPADISARIADKIAENTANTLSTDLKKLATVKAESGQSTVRVTFQRVIYNTAGQVTTAEQIKNPEVYKEFFDKLSQSVFLEAHEI